MALSIALSRDRGRSRRGKKSLILLILAKAFQEPCGLSFSCGGFFPTTPGELYRLIGAVLRVVILLYLWELFLKFI